MLARLACRILGHQRLELTAVLLGPGDPRITLALTCRRCGHR
jgi:hypothetical protein